ncbi:MAG TPA: universal stress protein [Devosiaceae bacterium]|nr:universal stress protein [Devosiaceae bacterium]
MEIRTILVNLDLDFYSPTLLKAAVELADRFDAQLIGVAAAAVPVELFAVDGTAVVADLYDSERAAIEEQLRGMEMKFRDEVPRPRRGTFATVLDEPNRVLTAAARQADLVIVGARLGEQEWSRSRNVDIGALLLASGRPVLLPAADTASIGTGTAVVGWKDTRETRRAVADALPLLKLSSDVVVAAVHEADWRTEKAMVDEVVGWLRRHDVKARGDIYPSAGGASSSLEQLAIDLEADLLVAGAYGHGRMREWFFGGVTRDLLQAATINRLMSN